MGRREARPEHHRPLAPRQWDEIGASAVEYGLLLALIAALILVAVTALGTNLRDIFQGLADLLPDV